VIEVVENDSLGHVFRRRVLDPLDMSDTSFVVPAQKLNRVAQPWQRPGGPPMTERFDVSRKHAFESAGAGLAGTMRDYLRFTTMLLRGGELDGKRILRPETIALMTRDHLGPVKGRSAEHGYGLGVEVRRVHTTAGTGLPGEYGWSGQAGTTFFIDPKRELIAILLVQVNDEDRMKLRTEFRRLVNEAVID
jgi:CubicO group peptidase (beta-lactamase class C family)